MDKIYIPRQHMFSISHVIARLNKNGVEVQICPSRMNPREQFFSYAVFRRRGDRIQFGPMARNGEPGTLYRRKRKRWRNKPWIEARSPTGTLDIDRPLPII